MDQGLDSQLVAAIIGGVIGIVGSIATLLASHFLRVSGKIIVNVTNVNLQYVMGDVERAKTETDSIDHADSLNVEIGIDLYNSSDIPRSLRAIKIELRSKRRNLYSMPQIYKIPTSENDRWLIAYSPLDNINLPSKELQHIEFRCQYKSPAIIGLKGRASFYLKALYPDGGSFQSHLLTTDIK